MTLIDFKTALVKLGERFGFKRLISDSGSILNGVLINEGIPSKLSLLIYPEIAGENYRKLFENVTVSMEFELLKTECKENGIIHCLYSVQKQKN
ncbi:dihydrofolate reductase family protein [Methanoeremita antiquus]|uniref:dihydrofolate reductase family protein n=1 Tax=Methanomicrobium antiquum TaxID=487686 RepID=UPI002417381F|nr:dihydrofolate reductase family protein [Methanomicrobium antiquum]